MPIESAFNYPSDLVATYPQAGDNPGEGDDHIRGIKNVLKTTFPNVNAAITATDEQLNFSVGVTSAIQTQLDAKLTAATVTYGLVLITATTASAVAAVDFTTGINSTYSEYEVHFINVVPATNNTALWVRTSTDAGATFADTAGDYLWTIARASGTAMAVTNGSTTATSVALTAASVSSTAATGGVSGVIKLFSPSNATANKTLGWSAFLPGTTASNVEAISGTGVRLATADIDAIRFMFSSGNITSGEFRLYGVRKV